MYRCLVGMNETTGRVPFLDEGRRGEILRAATHVHAFRVSIDRGGLAAASEKRHVGRIRLTITRPVRGTSSLGRRNLSQAPC